MTHFTEHSSCCTRTCGSVVDLNLVQRFFSQVYVETIALQIDKVSYGLLEISQHSFNP